MQAEIFYSAHCPYCLRARELLDAKGVSYQVRDVDANPALWQEITTRTGRETVPQIFIHNRYVGGCDDLYALEQAGKLDSWIQNIPPANMA